MTVQCCPVCGSAAYYVLHPLISLQEKLECKRCGDQEKMIEDFSDINEVREALAEGHRVMVWWPARNEWRVVVKVERVGAIFVFRDAEGIQHNADLKNIRVETGDVH